MAGSTGNGSTGNGSPSLVSNLEVKRHGPYSYQTLNASLSHRVTVPILNRLSTRACSHRVKVGWIYFAAGGFVCLGGGWVLGFVFWFVFFLTRPISLVATESRQSPRTTWGIRSVTGQGWGSKSGHQGWQQALYRMSHLTRPSFPFLRQTLEFT